MTLLSILQFHPLRDTLPDGTEVRLVLPVERTNNKPLYITSDGRPFSHVRVKDKATGDYRFEYHPLKPIFDTSKTNKYNGNRKQKYLKMTRTYGYILIHHAVYLAWVGPIPEDADCIDHLNGCTTDNRTENLEPVTFAENNRRARYLRFMRSCDFDPRIFSAADFHHFFSMPLEDFKTFFAKYKDPA